jgi:hypothetical protein
MHTKKYKKWVQFEEPKIGKSVCPYVRFRFGDI